MASYPTLHELRAAADEYWGTWQRLLAAAPDLRKVIGQHTPTALGWKVEGDLSPLEAAGRVYELGDSLFMGPVNQERAIMTVRKPEPYALAALQHIKILQRRPSKPNDSLGPDSLDFYVPHGIPKLSDTKKAVDGVDTKLELESNDLHAWLSLTYQGHEFKLADHHLWDVCVKQAAGLIDRELA